MTFLKSTNVKILTEATGVSRKPWRKWGMNSVSFPQTAVIALDGQDFKKHSGVISYFRDHYIKTKVFNRQCSDIVSSSSLIRNKSDYDDFYIASIQETHEQVENMYEMPI